jgi:hypothetical protein
MVLSMASAAAAERRSLAERSAGRLVGRLGPEGYVVGSDGVVVGPTGVAIVTTLACTERLRIHHGELWHGRFPLRHELAVARRRAAQVREQVDAHGRDLLVRAFACVVGTPAPEDPYCVLEVELCGPLDLPDRICAAPSIVDLDEVLRLSQDLRSGARHRPGWMPPRWRPRRSG